VILFQDTLHLVQAIHLLSKAIPQIITVSKATALLPYLRPASSVCGLGFDVPSSVDSYIVVQPDQVALTETLLRMLCISIPHMPKTSVTFAQELSKLLLPMIGRPGGKLSVSSGSSPVRAQDPLRHLSRQTLEETVACYCVVVRHVTEEYGRVASILTSCITKLQRYQDACDSGKEPSSQEQKSIPFFIVISSLMVSSCDLDDVKADRAGKPKAAYPSPQTLINCRA
jgi:cohesin loading factor subunit SCC2